MAELIRRLIKLYQLAFYEYPDPRTKDLFLVAKPYQALFILGLYLMFVFKWGPRWMKNRIPFNVKKVLILYNAIQIVLCAMVFINGFPYWGWRGKFKWMCEPVDYSDSEDAINITRVVYLYYVIKILDLFDTVFFVLRKKHNQVSFLHVYHHTGMVLLIWGGVTYYPGGHGTFVGYVNSFVHMIMYSYYLLTIVLSRIRQVVWIKKGVTQLQIIQFYVFVIHMIIPIFKTDCAYPRILSALFLPQNFFMLVLFTDFYIKTYIMKPKKVSRENIKSEGTDSSRISIDNNYIHNKVNRNGDLKIEHFITNHRDSTSRNVKRT